MEQLYILLDIGCLHVMEEDFVIFLQCFYSLEDTTHKRDKGGDWGGGGGVCVGGGGGRGAWWSSLQTDTV